ncbi:DNA polymerase III subunit gamma/tau [Burkholderia sp. WAC0059]|uniref:DNA polymerase III subunit gamma/tau n=1 Tax=Burkholderia sp. WAC0059 TaxID=2066022 RepID=UPI000C7F6C83|nr:DNA polymerase III subunit gamma/tau [Burkholderia sp. WAC0059]PLZ03652.1 DNA polymerase III subunit gamma/tau [Burkholderia sp. WAC0059]
MTYQVLARKWRPKDFASLVGQEHVVRALTHALDGGRLHHAYLFTGTRGVGKTTLSRIFAKALNCETGVSSTPCGVCRACREIDEGRFVDYVEMDAASNRGVDEMAALLERAVYAPVDARFKVYMIDEVHMLTNHAFNAMLKTLEEPPQHVKFILATTDPQKIPVTVLSRCLQFNLKQMPAGHIVSHLERILGEEQVAFEPQALRLLARAADGSMRDALSLTDQAIAYSANQVSEEAVRGMLGALDQSYLIRLIDALVAGDGPAVLAIADEMALRSLSFSTALQDLASLFHRIAWAQFSPSSVLDEWPEAGDLRRFAQGIDPQQVQLFYQIATLGRSELGLAPDEYAGFTMTLLRMLAFEPSASAGGGSGSGPVSKPAQATGTGGRSPAPAMTAGQGAASAAAAGVAVQPKPVVPSAEGLAGTTESPVVGKTADEPSSSVPEATDVPAPQPVSVESASSNSVATLPEDKAANVVEVSTVDSQGPQALPAKEETEKAVLPAPGENAVATAPDAAQRRGGGASAALDVLRNAGMKISSGRGAHVVPAAPSKPAAPRAAVVVPTPDPSRRVASQGARAGVEARNGAARQAGGANRAEAVPPWDDAPPPDDYVPATADDAWFAPPDDGFVPVFDHDPGESPRRGAAAEPPVEVVDVSQLPPGIALDALGFAGDWPELAADLPLKGIAYQLAFNSELTALDGETLRLNVPVPQYAEASQVAKLKAALAGKLGRPLDVQVTVGPARRTAAVLDAAARAERQREAEREIGGDPFVQALIRDFGASIVPGSVRPLASDAGPGGTQTVH